MACCPLKHEVAGTIVNPVCFLQGKWVVAQHWDQRSELHLGVMSSIDDLRLSLLEFE